MKKIILASAAVLSFVTVAALTRPLQNDSLTALDTLAFDTARAPGVAAVISLVNPVALELLPTSATLRIENAIAEVAIAQSATVVAAR